MKRMVLVIVVGALACGKQEQPPPPVPWADLPLKGLHGTLDRTRSHQPPLAWSLSVPERMTEATEVIGQRASSPNLRMFYDPQEPSLSAALHACSAAPGEDPTVQWRQLNGSNAQPIADGLEVAEHQIPDFPRFAFDVIRVQGESALCCTATYLQHEITDHQTAVLHAICESAKIE